MVINVKKQLQDGHEYKRNKKCPTAPMGAIAQDYRAFSDLGLHTGDMSLYIYLKSLQGKNCFLNKNLKHNKPSVLTEKNIQPKLYYESRDWQVNIEKQLS